MIDIDETLKLTQSQGQGSRSIPAGKHFWKYKNVHLYQTGATDIFTRRKCPCSWVPHSWPNPKVERCHEIMIKLYSKPIENSKRIAERSLSCT